MNKLVTTAKRPDTEIAWPAIPSVVRRSAAIGVSRLTGMNSEAISIATHSVIEPTALQICRREKSDCILAVVRSWSARGTSKMPVLSLLVFMVSVSFCCC